jgi:hypothetical protein
VSFCRPEEAQSASIREGVLLAQEQAQKNQNIKVDMIIRGRAGQWGADADEAARDGHRRQCCGLNCASGWRGVAPRFAGIGAHSGAGGNAMRRFFGKPHRSSLDAASSAANGGRGSGFVLKEYLLLLSQKPKRWMAVVPEGRAGRECSRDLRQAASDAHCEFAGTVEVSSTSTNFDVTWQRVMKSHPDGILIWLAPVPAGEFVRNARRGGFTGVLAGPSWLDSAGFVAAAQGSLERFVVPVIARNNASTGLFGAFKSAYRTRWGRDPDPMAGYEL